MMSSENPEDKNTGKRALKQRRFLFGIFLFSLPILWKTTSWHVYKFVPSTLRTTNVHSFIVIKKIKRKRENLNEFDEFDIIRKSEETTLAGPFHDTKIKLLDYIIYYIKIQKYLWKKSVDIKKYENYFWNVYGNVYLGIQEYNNRYILFYLVKLLCNLHLCESNFQWFSVCIR